MCVFKSRRRLQRSSSRIGDSNACLWSLPALDKQRPGELIDLSGTIEIVPPYHWANLSSANQCGGGVFARIDDHPITASSRMHSVTTLRIKFARAAGSTIAGIRRYRL